MARREKEKEAIYQRMKAAEEQRKKELEQLEQLRLDYYTYISEEQQQRKDEEEQRKQV